MTDKLRTLAELKADWVRQHPGKPFPGRTPAAPVPGTPPTAEQERIVREAIEARDRRSATATAPAYTGKDYMELVEEYRDKRNCSLLDAFMAVNKKHPEARRDYIRRNNPHLYD